MDESNESTITRREMIAGTTAAVAALAFSNVTGVQQAAPHTVPLSKAKVSFTVNGQATDLEMDTRTTLLDALREHLHVYGHQKRLRSRPVRGVYGAGQRPTYQFLPVAGPSASGRYHYHHRRAGNAGQATSHAGSFHQA